MGYVQEAELEILLRGGFLIGGLLRTGRSRHRKPGSALLSAIVVTIRACSAIFPPLLSWLRDRQRDSAARGDSVSQKWNGADLSTRFWRRNTKMMRASVEQHFICQFPAR
jgi:hypothetical protein